MGPYIRLLDEILLDFDLIHLNINKVKNNIVVDIFWTIVRSIFFLQVFLLLS